jgi:putative membrane protein
MTVADVNSTHRDELAVERTRLANERTLLAYIRTSLALLGGGILLVRLVGGRLASATGFALVLCGIFLIGCGMVRFRSVQRRVQQGSAPR